MANVTRLSGGLSGVFLAVAVMLPPTAALAEDDSPRDKAAELSRQATKNYQLGNFTQALDAYNRAYESYPAPGLLFNIGQCHMALEHFDRAIFFFEGYLRDKPDAANRALVESLITEAQAKLEAQREAAHERREDEKRLAEEERRKAEAEATSKRLELAVRSTPPKRADAPLYKKWWFWTAVGSVALTAGGVYFLTTDTGTVLPAGSLGTWDAR